MHFFRAIVKYQNVSVRKKRKNVKFPLKILLNPSKSPQISIQKGLKSKRNKKSLKITSLKTLKIHKKTKKNPEKSLSQQKKSKKFLSPHKNLLSKTAIIPYQTSIYPLYKKNQKKLQKIHFAIDVKK